MDNYYLKMLKKKNEGLIDILKSESVLWLSDVLRNNKNTGAADKECVIVSHTTPVASPPFLFGFSDNDVCYIHRPLHEEDLFEKLETALAKTSQPFVVFVERNGHRQELEKIIDLFLARRKSMTIPEFVLAEYQSPLTALKLTPLGGNRDSL